MLSVPSTGYGFFFRCYIGKQAERFAQNLIVMGMCADDADYLEKVLRLYRRVNGEGVVTEYGLFYENLVAVSQSEILRIFVTVTSEELNVRDMVRDLFEAEKQRFEFETVASEPEEVVW